MTGSFPTGATRYYRWLERRLAFDPPRKPRALKRLKAKVRAARREETPGWRGDTPWRADMQRRLAEESTRRWREWRRADGKNPYPSMMEVFGETLMEHANMVRLSLDRRMWNQGEAVRGVHVSRLLP